jgi:hypothetical protein
VNPDVANVTLSIIRQANGGGSVSWRPVLLLLLLLPGMLCIVV